MKRLVPAPNTRSSTARAMGCLVGLPLSFLTFVGIAYLAFKFGLTNGELTTVLILLGIAISITLARGFSNWLADQWLVLALRIIDSPTISISPEKVRIGNSFTVVYHQVIPKPIVINQLVLQLVRVSTHKRDVFGVQDNFRKDEKIYQSITRKGREFKSGEIFHREVLFSIPGSAPPTTDTKEIYEQWLIHTHLSLRAIIDFDQDYILKVEGGRFGPDRQRDNQRL